MQTTEFQIAQHGCSRKLHDFEDAVRSGIIGSAADMPFRSHRFCDTGRNRRPLHLLRGSWRAYKFQENVPQNSTLALKPNTAALWMFVWAFGRTMYWNSGRKSMPR
jgi:hypothetical protein